MQTYSYSNIGRRNTQEDYILSKDYGQSVSLHVVADGMGGYQAGDIASKTVANSVADSLLRGLSFADAAVLANRNVASEQQTLGVPKMGCTVAGVFIKNMAMSVFWVGDSRVYLFRDGNMEQLTEDHSLLAQISKRRRLTHEMVEKYGSVVTRAIMGNETDTFEVKDIELQAGDEIIVCSDGLYRDCPVDCLVEMIRNNTLEIDKQNDMFDDNHSFIYIKI